VKNLVIIGHPNTESFCYSGIFKTIENELLKNKEEVEVIDLYRDSFTRPRVKLIKKYQSLVTWSERIYFISPVWWFRLTPRMEIFFDEVFEPGFAYEFVNITKLYAYPKPFLKDKKSKNLCNSWCTSYTCANSVFKFCKIKTCYGGIYICIWLETFVIY
jgi:putative NADPH-quinone reductase